MFNLLKQPKRLVFCISYFSLAKNHRFITTVRPLVVNYSTQITLRPPMHDRDILLSIDQFRLIVSRSKYKKSKMARKYDENDGDSDEEDELEGEDDLSTKEPNLKTFSVKSMRIDAILKTVFTISRKKVEDSFYQNRIRLNGKIVNKKSRSANEDDEIDMIVGFAKNSRDDINVHRVKILKVEPNPENDRISIKVWKMKSLRINNYADGNPWREPEEENL